VYSKSDDASGDVILVVVNLDPHHVQAGYTWLDLDALGVAEDRSSRSTTCSAAAPTGGAAADNYVELDPHISPPTSSRCDRPPHRTSSDH
jgi:starch synthase (maltosyl-transferring)